MPCIVKGTALGGEYEDWGSAKNLELFKYEAQTALFKDPVRTAQ